MWVKFRSLNDDWSLYIASSSMLKRVKTTSSHAVDHHPKSDGPGPAKPALHRHPEVARILEKMLIYHDLSIKIHRTISIYIYIHIYILYIYRGHFPSGIWEFDPERWRFTHEKNDGFRMISPSKKGDSADIWICPTGKFINHWDFSNAMPMRNHQGCGPNREWSK